MNILDDIATWITSSSTGISGAIGGGTSSAYPVYKGKMPPSTGNMYIIYQYGGVSPEPIRDGTIDNPRLSVRTVTAATSDNGYLAALIVSNRLRYVANRNIPTSTGSYYIMITPLQSPESLGVDSNGRMQWVQNFQVSVSYS